MKPLLSIIVPIYNVSKYIDTCVRSILAQTFTDFELILVDDGSTDGSSEICDEYAVRDDRIKVIHKKNGGVVSARKEGAKVASGKYAGYVDGDDWIEPHMYQSMVEYMEEYNCDMVMCDVDHESRNLPMSSGGTRTDIAGGYYDRDKLEKEIFPKMIYSGEFFHFGIYPVVWNKLYRLDKLREHQMAVDESIKMGEDAACVYPYMYDANSMYFIKNMSLYHYRRSENQMTATYDELRFERFKALYNFFSNSSVASSPYASQLDYYYSYCIKNVISNELSRGNSASFGKKLHNIKNICSFAREEGFVSRINVSHYHKLYFGLVRKNKPLLIVLGIYLTRLIQRIFE